MAPLIPGQAAKKAARVQFRPEVKSSTLVVCRGREQGRFEFGSSVQYVFESRRDFQTLKGSSKHAGMTLSGVSQFFRQSVGLAKLAHGY